MLRFHGFTDGSEAQASQLSQASGFGGKGLVNVLMFFRGHKSKRIASPSKLTYCTADLSHGKTHVYLGESCRVTISKPLSPES